jgi:hypothetical protein
MRPTLARPARGAPRRLGPRRLLLGLLAAALAFVVPFGTALDTDSDGPDDCTRPVRDFGDAPEGIEAYPGIMGRFPTCTAPTPTGTPQVICAALGSPPGAATGFVRHENPLGAPPYWLGCFAAGPPMGVDSESDGKVNATGGAASQCSPNVLVDCVEPSWLPFGQDECYGDNDAGLAAAISFATCQDATLSFRAYNCSQTARVVTLNILVDWNQDGDWNDNFECSTGCAHEWAVKNVTIVLPPGCSSITSPAFRAGPHQGQGWLRLTLTDNAVTDDFPWNGSAGMAGQIVVGGETEDYPVTITGPTGACAPYRDYGDAPEQLPAYSSGVAGHFPTCEFPGAPATADVACGPPPVFPPGPTGFVRHDVAATNPVKFWLGCPVPGFDAVDSESNGKVNVDPPMGLASRCDPSVAVDCFEPAWLGFGQDECYGDQDAGIPALLRFKVCSVANVDFRAYSCAPQPLDVFLNILVDWNEDGDWTDNVACSAVGCSPEWAVRNVPIPLNPGCNGIASPAFPVGEKVGEGWLRITLTDAPVPDDFPWNGSVSMPNQSFRAGETEDYPVRIDPTTTGVGDVETSQLAFAPATPNPAHTWTQLRWSQPRAAHASLTVYDLVGRRVARLVDAEMTSGDHLVSWSFKKDEGGLAPPGIYLAKLRVGGEEITTRIVRLK